MHHHCNSCSIHTTPPTMMSLIQQVSDIKGIICMTDFSPALFFPCSNIPWLHNHNVILYIHELAWSVQTCVVICAYTVPVPCGKFLSLAYSSDPFSKLPNLYYPEWWSLLAITLILISGFSDNTMIELTI